MQFSTYYSLNYMHLADRRGFVNFLRSRHSSANETSIHSRHSLPSDEKRSHNSFIGGTDYFQDMEHERVIDSFVVITIVIY